MKILSLLATISWKIEIELFRSVPFQMKTRVCLKYFLDDCLWKQFFASNLPQAPSNLNGLTSLVVLRPLAQFKPKIRATKLQKSATICFT